MIGEGKMEIIFLLLLGSSIALLYSDLSFTKEKVNDLEKKMEKLLEEKSNH